jgi:predicted enzyme related to lactoylglutathione lyase
MSNPFAQVELLTHDIRQSGGWFSVIQDPQGAMLALWKPKTR